MTIEQLARSTRSVFELHYESLTGLPFFTSFPLNCCQGASVVFGMLVSLLPTQHMVTVVKGDTRDRRESHYWLEIDGLIYDLTLDQFQETLGNRFDGINAPLYGAAKHPLRMHFFYKERHSAVLAFSIFAKSMPTLRRSMLLCSSFAMRSKFNEKSTLPASIRIHRQLRPPSLMSLTEINIW